MFVPSWKPAIKILYLYIVTDKKQGYRPDHQTEHIPDMGYTNCMKKVN